MREIDFLPARFHRQAQRRRRLRLLAAGALACAAAAGFHAVHRTRMRTTQADLAPAGESEMETLVVQLTALAEGAAHLEAVTVRCASGDRSVELPLPAAAFAPADRQALADLTVTGVQNFEILLRGRAASKLDIGVVIGRLGAHPAVRGAHLLDARALPDAAPDRFEFRVRCEVGRDGRAG